MVRLASSKLQDEAACATPAAASRNAEANGWENRIVVVLFVVLVAKGTFAINSAADGEFTAINEQNTCRLQL